MKPEDEAEETPLVVATGEVAKVVRLLDLVIAGLLHDEPPLASALGERPASIGLLPLMVQALGSSTHSLLRLSDRPGLQTRECFGIARSIAELAINVGFILAEGDSIADDAMRHANQKAVRDLRRESSAGRHNISLQWRGLEDLQLPDGLAEAMEEFTSKAGREKPWTSLSVDARIDRMAAGRLSGQVVECFHFARFITYRHASEVLHGSPFSVLYFAGLTSPSGAPRSPEEWQRHIEGLHFMLLTSVVMADYGVVRAFGEVCDVQQIVEISQRQAHQTLAAIVACFDGMEGQPRPSGGHRYRGPQ